MKDDGGPVYSITTRTALKGIVSDPGLSTLVYRRTMAKALLELEKFLLAERRKP